MQKGKIIGAFLIIVVVLIAAWQAFSVSSNLKKPSSTAANIAANVQEKPAEEMPLGQEKAIVLIDNGLTISQEFEFAIFSTTTAFDLLKQVEMLSGLAVESKDHGDMGMFIEAIGGVKNGTDNKYWLYYLNGKMPLVSASKQLVNPGDRVEFRFEKSPF